jgi:hypothetical protein
MGLLIALISAPDFAYIVLARVRSLETAIPSVPEPMLSVNRTMRRLLDPS